MDRRENWIDYREGHEVPGVGAMTRRQTSPRNGAYEYVAIDPDNPQPTPIPDNTPPTPRTLVYDGAGNLTFNRWARNMGEPCDRSPLAADCSTNGTCDTSEIGCNLGQEYAYDTENRLVRVWRDRNNMVGPLTGGSAEPKLMEFVYDALGRRVETIEYIDSATGATLADPRRTRHVYFGLEVIQEYTCGPSYAWCGSGPELVREFMHGDPERYPEVVAMIEHRGTGRTENVPAGGFVYHYLHDALGSVIGLVDEDGTLVERYTYDPYGKVFIEKWDATANGGQGDWLASAEPVSGMPYSSVGNPFMWTGHRYDAAVGLYHAPERTYSPIHGRWLQRDPEEYIDGMNLYEYVKSSPLVLIDPLGTTSDMPTPSGACPSDDYKQDKCRAAANKALSNCLKSEKAGGCGAPTRDDCFETFSQSMDACARGKPGTHDKEVKRGFQILDCMGRCLDSLNAAQISIGAGIGSQIPIPKNLGGIQILRGPGRGKLIDVIGGGLADRLPGGLRDSVGSQLTKGLKGIRAAGTVQAGIIISGGVALSFEAYCAVRCGANNRAY